MPKSDALDIESNLLFRGLKCRNGIAVLIKHCVTEDCALGGSIYLYLNLSVSALYCRSHLKTRCSVVFELEVVVFCADKVYVSVQTAVECEVCYLRIYSVVGSVVNRNGYKVVILYFFGKVNSEGRVSAVVVNKVLTADIYIGRGVSAVYFKIVSVSIRKRIFCKFLEIVASTAVIVVTAVLTVGCVPCVREIYFFRLSGNHCKIICFRLGEGPVGIEAYYFSHFFSIQLLSLNAAVCNGVSFLKFLGHGV